MCKVCFCLLMNNGNEGMSVFLCIYYWANNFVSWFFSYIPATISPDISCLSQKVMFLITIYCFNSNLYWNFSTTIILPWDTSDYFSLTYNIEIDIAMHKAFLIQIIYEDTFIIVNSYLKQHEYFWGTWYVFPNYFEHTLYIYSAVVYIIDYHVFLFW